MKITERRLRSIIRSVIKESNKEHKFTHWYENFHDEVNLMGKSYKNDPKRYLNQLGVVLEKANQWGGPLDPEFKGADEFGMGPAPPKHRPAPKGAISTWPHYLLIS